MMAVIQAIQAHDTLTGSDPGSRLAGSFAIFFTKMAIGAILSGLADAPQGISAQHTEKCTQRAYKAAIKTRNYQVHEHCRNKNCADQPGTLIIAERLR